MSYQSLLVYLDPDPSCDVRTRVAIELARRFGSHLCGIAPTGLVDMPTSIESASALAEYAANAFDDLRVEAAHATQRFAHACIDGGLESFDLMVDESDRETSLTRRAHCSDLTIVGQADPAIDPTRSGRDLVEKHVRPSARPTLVCPYAGCPDRVGERVLVAWDDSREATRALSDALPFLRAASQVHVACWSERGSRHPASKTARLKSLQRWLRLHDVEAEWQLESTDTGISEAILSRVADWSADLVVMGAYGHSRLAEKLLGGASQGMLRSMTTPVLMSH